MMPATYWEPGLRMEHDPGIKPEALLAAIGDPGAVIKQSRRTVVRRVGEWAIKESKAGSPLHWLDLTFRAERYTKAWDLGLRLREAGITVPAPVASVSRHWHGLCTYRATITEWLEGWQDVEDAARALHAADAGPAEITRLLEGIAMLHTRLSRAGFRHADLSGKNIYCRTTAQGFEYALIDLDSAEAEPISNDMRFRNAVQLHDSFCDLWEDATLAPMALAIMDAPADDEATLARVVSGQKARRARIEAIWARQRAAR